MPLSACGPGLSLTSSIAQIYDPRSPSSCQCPTRRPISQRSSPHGSPAASPFLFIGRRQPPPWSSRAFELRRGCSPMHRRPNYLYAKLPKLFRQLARFSPVQLSSSSLREPQGSPREECSAIAPLLESCMRSTACCASPDGRAPFWCCRLPLVSEFGCRCSHW